MQTDNVTPVEEEDEDEAVLMILSNEPNEFKVRTLELVYQAASVASIAYMDGKDPETGEIVPLLVGIQPTEDGKTAIWPFARLLDGKSLKKYRVPDGAGEYYASASNGYDFDVELHEEEGGSTEGLDKKQIN